MGVLGGTAHASWVLIAPLLIHVWANDIVCCVTQGGKWEAKVNTRPLPESRLMVFPSGGTVCNSSMFLEGTRNGSCKLVL